MDKITEIFKSEKVTGFLKGMKNNSYARIFVVVFAVTFLLSFSINYFSKLSFNSNKEFNAIAVYSKDGDLYTILHDKNNKTWSKKIIENIKTNSNIESLAVSVAGDFALLAWQQKDKNKNPQIYYSYANLKEGSNIKWEKPKKIFDTKQPQTQIDVYALSSKNAMAIWTQNRWQLYYSLWNGKRWSDPKQINIGVFRYRIDKPSFIKIENEKGKYTIVFSVDGRMYYGYFDGKNWIISPMGKLASVHVKPEGIINHDEKKLTLSWVDNLEKANILFVKDDIQEQDKLQKSYDISVSGGTDNPKILIATENGVLDYNNQKKTIFNKKAKNIASVYTYDNNFVSLFLGDDGILYYSAGDKTEKIDNANTFDLDKIKITLDKKNIIKNLDDNFNKKSESPTCGNNKIEEGEECEINSQCKSGACDFSRKNIYFAPSCKCFMKESSNSNKNNENKQKNMQNKKDTTTTTNKNVN